MSSGDANLAELLRCGGYSTGMESHYASCLTEASKPILRRIRALKKNQLEALELESKFYEKVHVLEMEFDPLFKQIQEKRTAIVNGDYEPEDEECTMPLFHGRTEAELQKLEDEAPVEGTPSKGIPSFWFHCLNNTAQVSDSIFDYDKPILNYLKNITVDMHDSPPGYTLNFFFDSNPYFKNSVLTKYYELNLKVDPEDPFDYGGPHVVKSKGCQIDWKEGKSVTEKVVKKKVKKGPQAGQYVTKVDGEDITNDYEIGQILRDQIIPRAVLFYTGEAVEDDEDMFDDAEDEEVDDMEED